MPSSMIYSGIPGSSNPHAHGIGISIGGLFEQWSPLRLTNYSVDMSGVGTVQVLGSSSLVNSTMEMQGPNDNLLNEGLMTLQNSQLSINGSLAGSGMILATGGSTITVSYSTPIKDTYQQPLTKQQSSDLASAQPQLISLKSSTLDILGNAAKNYTGPVVMDAKSTVNITGELNVGAKNFGIYATDQFHLGMVNLNTDQVTHITGIMQIDANLNINSRGGVLEIDGGRLILGGASAGDTVAITSGTLEFSQIGFVHGPELESQNFTSKLFFAGNSGAVQFDGSAGSLMIGIMPNMSEIAVFSLGEKIADLHLAPSAQAYSASEFSVHGNTLLFHHS